jgi:demethylmenaquinone methyltransferase / 2-methoxy-6-polyprenyl-1,4-benzoquinol methylase
MGWCPGLHLILRPSVGDRGRREVCCAATMSSSDQVRSMFARIAGSYDLLNHALSLGIDRRWRRAVLDLAGEAARGVIVDACCGTGDLGLEFARRGGRVVGVDFTPEMLIRALPKVGVDGSRTLFVHGDALHLPVASCVADVSCVAFGLRNLTDRRRGLREMTRVVKKGGLVVVLEFSRPPGAIFGAVYRAYFTRLLPLLGRVVSRDQDAYSYLARTVMAWPSPTELEEDFRASGLTDCGHRLLTRGIACLHYGTRSSEELP